MEVRKRPQYLGKTKAWGQENKCFHHNRHLAQLSFTFDWKRTAEPHSSSVQHRLFGNTHDSLRLCLQPCLDRILNVTFGAPWETWLFMSLCKWFSLWSSVLGQLFLPICPLHLANHQSAVRLATPNLILKFSTAPFFFFSTVCRYITTSYLWIRTHLQTWWRLFRKRMKYLHAMHVWAKHIQDSLKRWS